MVDSRQAEHLTEAEILAAQATLEKALALVRTRQANVETTWRDDYSAGDLNIVDVATAARRFKLSVDTVKRHCMANPSIGGKWETRWKVSIRRFRDYLAEGRRRA